jgi:hypothetical protein
MTGVALILAAELAGGGVVKTALGDAGGLLAGSVALAVLYDIVVKPAETEDTVNLVRATVLGPVETALSSQSAEAAHLAERLSAPLARVLANQELLFAQRVKLSIPGATSAGFLGVEPRLDFKDLFERLRPGDQLMWLDTYCPVIRSAEDTLLSAVIAGAHVKMLAIDPEVANCAARAAEITEGAFNESIFRSESRAGLEHLREYAGLLDAKNAQGSVEVRLYAGLPCIPLYILMRDGQPHVGYTSFFLTRATFGEPHIVWGPDNPQGFLERFVTYFEHRWRLAATEYSPAFMHWPRPEPSAATS